MLYQRGRLVGGAHFHHGPDCCSTSSVELISCSTSSGKQTWQRARTECPKWSVAVLPSCVERADDVLLKTLRSKY